MNAELVFFVGCMTFVLMMGFKIPIKALTDILIEHYGFFMDDEKKHILRKRLNFTVIILTFVLAAICYFYVLRLLGETHFKWCCTLKAASIAIAIYAIYEQWFGKPEE